MASRSHKPKSSASRAEALPAPVPGRRARRHADTRERIFRAALKLFAQHGFMETTIEDITEAADVGKGTFFNYFPSKEHVLKAFGEIQRGKIETALLEARSAQTPFRVMFRRLGDALLEEPGRSPAFLRSAMIAHLSSESVRNHLCQNLALGRQKLAEFLALGQERGEVRRDIAPADLARGVQESFFGAMLFWCLHGGSDLKSWYEPLFPLVWTGLEARPAHGVSLSKE
jgi:AcrR family transcriptional regulator